MSTLPDEMVNKPGKDDYRPAGRVKPYRRPLREALPGSHRKSPGGVKPDRRPLREASPGSHRRSPGRPCDQCG